MSSENAHIYGNSGNATVAEAPDVRMASGFGPSTFYEITGTTKRRSSLQVVSRDFEASLVSKVLKNKLTKSKTFLIT